MGLVQNWFMRWSNNERKAAAMQETFQGLAYRFLVQEQLLLIAEDLMSRGLVSITSLCSNETCWVPHSFSIHENCRRCDPLFHVRKRLLEL